MRDLRATVLAHLEYPLRVLEVAREEQFDLDSLSLPRGHPGARCGLTICAA